jgi:hypothetical protein
MSWDQNKFLARLKETIDNLDQADTSLLCGELIAQVDQGEPIEAGTARRVLATLRRKGYFTLIERVTEALRMAGIEDPQIRGQYAQALIDQNKLPVAFDVIKSILADPAIDPEEVAEARGILGRAYKQLYVVSIQRGKSPLLPVNRRYLQIALDSYLSVYRSAPESHLWHGINAMALSWRAMQDGVPLEDIPDFKALARDIRETLKKGSGNGISVWDMAAAAEASLALDETEETLLWLSRYVRKRNEAGAYEADAFELASTRRQLKEVWGLTIDKSPGDLLLPLLEAQLLQRTGGRVDLTSSELKPTLDKIEKTEERASADVQFEKILGKEGVVSLSWYKTGLDRTLSVAKVLSKLQEGFGTGFLVRGGDLVPAWGDEVLLLTNAHVVSDTAAVQAQYGSLDPADAQVIFENFEAPAQKKYRVAKLLFTSPPTELDATLLRLDPPPPPCATYPVGKRLPALDGTQKIYIIGHPRGGGLSISLNDNLLLDWDDQKIHYRAPTEGGSSGSPVFNQTWDLIGLHHAGSMNLPKLKGQEGTYPANEGIWIQRIIKALSEAGVAGA